MKRKTIWLLVSGLMALSLVLASCAPAVVEEEKPPVVEEKPVVEPEKPVAPEKEMVRDMLGRLVEKPRYGGTFTFVHYEAPGSWDPCLTASLKYRFHFAIDNLVKGNFLKGPFGTNETSFLSVASSPAENLRVGALAESWEYVDPLTTVFHIRKGVHWQNKPPVNGREFTADDVVFNLKRHYSVSTAYLLTITPGGDVPTSIKALDRYTVEVKCPDPDTARVMFDQMSMAAGMLPPEVIEKYGDMTDWHNVVGTGPYIVEDVVGDTSAIMVRNPNYWEMDPLHPENRLPYPDKLSWVYITDESTRRAALRTGKADIEQDTPLEPGDILREQRPDLEYTYAPYLAPQVIYLNLGRTEAPWADKRVRQALALAMDNELIKRDFYQGKADLLSYPIIALKDTEKFIVPLEELPEETRELYEYHPEKAKQLLIDAGYPDGFEIEVICSSEQVPVLSIIKAQWDEIGVDMEIAPKDRGIWVTASVGEGFSDAAIFYSDATDPMGLASAVSPDGGMNLGGIDDARVAESMKKILAAYSARDDEECTRLIREIQPYIVNQQWIIQPPNWLRYMYMYQPWVKQFSGSYTLGIRNYFHCFRYLWLDEGLKKELGY